MMIITQKNFFIYFSYKVQNIFIKVINTKENSW